MKIKDFYEEVRVITDGKGKVVRVLLRRGIPVNRRSDRRAEFDYKGQRYVLEKGVKIRRFPKKRTRYGLGE